MFIFESTTFGLFFVYLNEEGLLNIHSLCAGVGWGGEDRKESHPFCFEGKKQCKTSKIPKRCINVQKWLNSPALI